MPVPLNERIFVALDVPSALQAGRLINRLASTGCGFKIGPHFVLDEGFSDIISALCGCVENSGNARFIDLKHLDIPETVKQAIAKAASRRFNYATVHAEPKSLAAAVDAAKDTILNVMAVLVLTSSDRGDPFDDGVLKERLWYALNAGCQGAICPADKLTLVRKIVPDHFILMTPGIRPLGYDTDDHTHVGTPKQAIDDGADFLVIGRPIIQSSDPVAAICRIIEEIK